jgi:hypothetical protein
MTMKAVGVPLPQRAPARPVATPPRRLEHEGSPPEASPLPATLHRLAVREEPVDTDLAQRAQLVEALGGYVRGVSPLAAWTHHGVDEFVAIVHEVYRPKATENALLSCYWPPPPGPSLIYVHRFARFDRELTRATLGPPFIIRTRGVEVCTGLVRRGDDFVATVEIEHRETWLAEIEDETIARMLSPFA